MKRLFLDDLRNPIEVPNYCCKLNLKPSIYHEYWYVVRSYTDFTDWISQNGLPDLISFDHDLGDVNSMDGSPEKTGYDCAKWLVNYCLDFDKSLPVCVVHSANPVGADNIRSLFLSFQKNQK